MLVRGKALSSGETNCSLLISGTCHTDRPLLITISQIRKEVRFENIRGSLGQVLRHNPIYYSFYDFDAVSSS